MVLLGFLGSSNRMNTKDSKALLDAMQSLPQDVVSWRLSLLRDFRINSAKLRMFEKPILLLASQEDKLLPSVDEGRELINYFPNSRLTILPESGHACLLEDNVNLLEILEKHDFLSASNTLIMDNGYMNKKFNSQFSHSLHVKLLGGIFYFS